MPITTRMVAATGWRFHKHGAPSKVLQYEKYRVPFDRTGKQVVVKMLAAPVHLHDKNRIQGTFGYKSQQFPAVAGTEGVGIIEEVGSGVTMGVKEGDLVWINNQKVGTFTTHLVTEPENLDVVPNRSDVDLEFLGSMSIFHTAYHLINSHAVLQPGDVVLQTGGSGSVAMVAAAYARSRGLKMFTAMQMGRTEHVSVMTKQKSVGSYAVVPYSYVRSNYMRRLLSDVPPPKLLLNSICGPFASSMINLLGDEGVCVTYGSAVSKPLQISNKDLIDRGISLKHFWLPNWHAQHSRENRMRLHQEVIDNITLSQGHAQFWAQRFKMDQDSQFAFLSAWDSPLKSRKPVLRMVGEYGEWRKLRSEEAHFVTGRAIWDDCLEHILESASMSDHPQAMRYYTTFDDLNSVFNDAKQSREMGHRDVFFRRPNAPRHNTAEQVS